MRRHRLRPKPSWRREGDQPPSLREPSAHRAHRWDDCRLISIAVAKLVDHERRGLARRKPVLSLAAEHWPGMRSGFVASVDGQSQSLDVRCQSRPSPETETAPSGPDQGEAPCELASALQPHELSTAMRRAQPKMDAVGEKPESTRAASPVAADCARRSRSVHRRRGTVRDGHTGWHLARALAVACLTGSDTSMAPFPSS